MTLTYLKPINIYNTLNRSPIKRQFMAFIVVMFGMSVFAMARNADGTVFDMTSAGSGEFQSGYEFFLAMATGYVARTICVVGGLIGLGAAAMGGRMILGLVGVLLAIFGVFGPMIINNVFTANAFII